MGTLTLVGSDLSKEFAHYREHQDELVRLYEGRYIVIVDEQVVGDFDSAIEAYQSAARGHRPGTFLVQLVTPGDEAYSQVFHSRVAL